MKWLRIQAIIDAGKTAYASFSVLLIPKENICTCILVIDSLLNMIRVKKNLDIVQERVYLKTQQQFLHLVCNQSNQMMPGYLSR